MPDRIFRSYRARYRRPEWRDPRDGAARWYTVISVVDSDTGDLLGLQAETVNCTVRVWLKINGLDSPAIDIPAGFSGILRLNLGGSAPRLRTERREGDDVELFRSAEGASTFAIRRVEYTPTRAPR